MAAMDIQEYKSLTDFLLSFCDLTKFYAVFILDLERLIKIDCCSTVIYGVSEFQWSF